MMTQTLLRTEQEDSEAARVDLRLKFLGWTRAHLAQAMDRADGRRGGLKESTIRNLLTGAKPITAGNWLPRIAVVVRVPESALRPGADWAPLVRGWFAHPDARA